MYRALRFIKSKTAILLAVVGATVVASASTAVVMAAIPDGDGIIHSCRVNLTGTIRIIDSASQSCNGLETAVNWSQGGGGSILHDANGQVLGNILSPASGDGQPFSIYNSTLNRFILIGYSTGAGRYTIMSAGNSVYFQSNNCTGQPYTYDDPRHGTKTNLIRTGSSSYGTVQDNATAQTVTLGSILQPDYETDSFSCVDIDNFSDAAYTISSASLPFTMPIAGPFKF